ncbi:MAG: glycosyltransferase [Microthrixaceae bacterium]
MPSSRPTSPTPASTDAWSPDEHFVEGYDVAPEAESPIVGVGVPAVVAVVVCRDPGPWFEATLESIGSQDYANLTTLVVDAGSIEDPAPRVAAVIPQAFVKHTEFDSFAAAANTASDAIDGAAFFLFCHDDVALSPGSVQAMVEEAFRSNAGIVGGKLVEWDRPDRLLSVGGTIDKFGFEWPIVEPDEMDQAQHDAIRETFFVSSAAMLVRADLFEDLGGFATDIDGMGEDLDLCWRARVAGASVVVMPHARVRHRGHSAVGESSGRLLGLRLRHQARITLVSYGLLSLLVIVPQAVLAATVDLAVALARGRIAQARAIVGAFAWNVAHLRSTWNLRRRTQAARATPDRRIRRLQVPGSVRLSAYVHRLSTADRSVAAGLAAAARDFPNRSPGDPDSPRENGLWTLSVAVLAAVAIWFGARHLLSGGVPQVRDFVSFGGWRGLLSQWWTGWRPVGGGTAEAAPTITGIAGAAGWLTFGSMGLVRTLMLIGPLPLGAFAVWRLGRGVMSPQAKAVAVFAYLVNPIPYNALSEGRWASLVLYAVAPAVFVRVARAGQWAPFHRSLPTPGSTPRQIVGLGVLLAVASSVVPSVFLLAAFVVVALLVAVRFDTGTDRSRATPGRALVVTAGSVGLALLIHLPWTLAVFASPQRWEILLGGSPSRVAVPSVWRSLMFDTGGYGGVFSVGLVVIVVLAVLLCTRRHLVWAITAMLLTVVSAGLVAVAARFGGGSAMPPPESLLCLAGLGSTMAAMLVAEAVRTEVGGRSFGWRQPATLVAVVGLVIAALPVTMGYLKGRFSTPEGDLPTALAPLAPATRGAVANERTLWIGDADALGRQGWTVGDGLKFAVTDGLSTDVGSLYPPAVTATAREVRRVVESFLRPGSAQAGRALSTAGVRYVVLVGRLAPLPYGKVRFPLPSELSVRLSEQFDLSVIDVVPGVTVFENLAALPIRYTVPDEVASGLRSDADLQRQDRSRVAPFTARGSTATSQRGTVPAGSTLVVASALDGWTATESEGRHRAVAAGVRGGTSRFEGVAGPVALGRATPGGQVALHLVQLLVLAALPWFRRRRVSERRGRAVDAVGHIADPVAPPIDAPTSTSSSAGSDARRHESRS